MSRDRALSYSQREVRRRRARALLAAGNRPSAVAHKVGLSAAYVRELARKHAAPVDTGRARCSEFELLAALFVKEDSYFKIAERFGITRARVGQVYEKAKRAGIPVPVRKRGGPRKSR